MTRISDIAEAFPPLGSIAVKVNPMMSGVMTTAVLINDTIHMGRELWRKMRSLNGVELEAFFKTIKMIDVGKYTMIGPAEIKFQKSAHPAFDEVRWRMMMRGFR